jgi:hypothetical protein
VFWYSPQQKNAPAFAGRARPIPGPAKTWAGKFRVAAKNKDLRLFHDFPPKGGSCSNFRPAAIWAVCTLPATTQAANLVGGLRRIHTPLTRTVTENPANPRRMLSECIRNIHSFCS